MSDIVDDKKVSGRNRVSRLIALIGTAMFCSIAISSGIASLIPDTQYPLFNSLALGLSFILGIGCFILLLPRFFVRVSPNTIFITQDLLAGVYGSSVDVVYGPGFHISFPWEGRSSTGVISLEEATVTFDFKVTLPEGQLSGKAAYWLRADPMRPIEFLRSVASVGKELEKLVIAEIQGHMGDEGFRENVNISDTSRTIRALNELLRERFVEGKHPIESDNGIIITGVAVAELSPSDELVRTLTAVTEARTFQTAVAILLGFETPEGVKQALDIGRLTPADVDAARRAFMVISGNMEGVQRYDLNLSVSGISPELASALAAFAKTPAGIALASRVGNAGQQRKGRKK